MTILPARLPCLEGAVLAFVLPLCLSANSSRSTSPLSFQLLPLPSPPLALPSLPSPEKLDSRVSILPVPAVSLHPLSPSLHTQAVTVIISACLLVASLVFILITLLWA